MTKAYVVESCGDCPLLMNGEGKWECAHPEGNNICSEKDSSCIPKYCPLKKGPLWVELGWIGRKGKDDEG